MFLAFALPFAVLPKLNQSGRDSPKFPGPLFSDDEEDEDVGSDGPVEGEPVKPGMEKLGSRDADGALFADDTKDGPPSSVGGKAVAFFAPLFLALFVLVLLEADVLFASVGASTYCNPRGPSRREPPNATAPRIINAAMFVATIGKTISIMYRES